ncbi:MAG: phosphatidate cytidylyltransferase [Flavobacteriales bacterium]
MRPSNLLTRTISSIAFVVLILGPLFISDSRFAFTLYALLGGFTLNEVINLIQKGKTRVQKPLAITLYIMLVLSSYAMLYLNETSKWALIGLGLFSLTAAVLELFNVGDRPFEQIASTLLTPIYVAASFLGIAYFFEYRSDLPTPYITISVFALIWINDSGAYLIGRKLGRTKLYERLSPNKTWEGSIGGMLCALAAGYVLSMLDGMPNTAIMIGFAFTCILFGSFGDLLESRIKRAAGVKDSGRFLPGHGGFFDRFDAMMLAVPAAILFFEIALPKS